MKLFNELKKALKVFLLDKNAIKEVSNNSSTWFAFMLFGFWSLIAGIITLDYMLAIGWFSEAVIITYVIALIIYLIALIFNSKIKFMHLYKPWGYAQLFVGIGFLINKLSTTNSLLIIALLLEAWCIIIAYTIIKTMYKLETWKSVIIILVPILIIIILITTKSLPLLEIVIRSGVVSKLVV